MACPTYDESRDYKVLKDTIYHEARGESREGQIAVAWVIINRANHAGKRWPDNIAGVCKQECQFECWNAGMDTSIREKSAYESIDNWLKNVLRNEIPDPTGGSNHYNNPSKESPYWAKVIPKTVKIGAHQFYKDP